MTDRRVVTNAWWKLVRFGFRLLYNEFAFTYDTVSQTVSLGRWRCWQRSALKYLPPQGTVLELAHGTGDLQLDLYAAGYRVFGHDLSASMGQITRDKLRRAQQPVRLSRGFAQKLPYGAAVFDAVVSTFPTEFIVAAPTLHEVQRVLKSDGVFVVVPNGVLTGKDAVAQSLEWLYRITGQRGEASPEGEIARFFSDFGFEARYLYEPCPHSVAMLIVARKKD